MDWFLVFKILLLWLGEESIPINWHFSFGLRQAWINELVLVLVFNSAVLDHELSFLEKGLMLRLEHLQLLESIVTNLLELSFILSVNLSLDLLPVIMGELLLIFKVIHCLLAWNRHRSLIDGLLDGHLSDSWAHILDRLSNRLARLDDLWSLFHEIWLNWVDILEVLLLLLYILLHWSCFHILNRLSVLWLKLLWWRRLDDDLLNLWSIELLWFGLNILHLLLLVVSWILD